ncbi:Signal peptidase complex catalytic subunit SEC11C [Trichinella britovi]|uniref:Metalloendopeptidase n=1 Tax=Trichinella britovi TaxID=45882 RepID=A0A0V1CEC4_TRIBR|nr:Signal peptidase complex catalytic subunit SEC11C [Trichinella britovi]
MLYNLIITLTSTATVYCFTIGQSALESGRFIGAGFERRKDVFEQSDKLIQWCQQMTASNFADCERELKNWCYDLGNKVKLPNLPDVCLPLFRTSTDEIAQPSSGNIFNNFYSNKPKSIYTEAVTKEQIRELKAAFSAIELNSFGEQFQNNSMKKLKPIFDTQKNIRRSSNSFATAANELDVNNLKTLFMGDLKLTNNQWKALMEEAKILQRSTDEQVYRDLRSTKNEQRPIIEKWHTNHILYRMEASLKDASRDAILRALQLWQENTCIRFEERDQLEPNVALINFVDDSQSDGGCSSFVGRVGGIQNISIAWPRCSSEGIVSHQIGHALGLLHEHSRPDRDEHIIVNYEQTVSEHRDVISRLSSRVFEHFRSMYDPGSVMHMPPTVKTLMTNADELTILAMDPNYQSTFGQRISPSFLDYKLINMMYCNNKCSTKLDCLHGGYVNVNDCSRCTCPTGFEGPLCEHVDNGGDHCGGELISSDQPMLVQSPSYPESFQPYQECYWLLKAPSNNQKVVLEFVDVFDFPCEEVCSDSYVELNAGPNFDQTGYRFCCNTQPPSKMYYSNGSEMLIIFKAGTKTANGFRVRYWTAPKEEKIIPAPEVITDSCPCEQWSEWSPCSQNCGGCGNTVRQRICHSGVGLYCPATQSRLCNLDQCVGSKVILNNGEFHILFNGCCVGLFPDDEGHCQQPGDIASILGSLIPINMADADRASNSSSPDNKAEERSEVEYGSTNVRVRIVVVLSEKLAVTHGHRFSLAVANKKYIYCFFLIATMPSGKRESERKGNPPVNTGPSPNSDERDNNTLEEVNEPARGSGSKKYLTFIKNKLNYQNTLESVLKTMSLKPGYSKALTKKSKDSDKKSLARKKMIEDSENALRNSPKLQKRLVFPGDDLGPVFHIPLAMGPGVRLSSNQLISTHFGMALQRKDGIWIDFCEKAYFPYAGDRVVGIVVGKWMDYWKVEIGAWKTAIIHYLSFENATKRMRPVVNMGDVIYGRLKHDIEPELVCKDEMGKANNLGILPSDGMMLKMPPAYARRLLGRKKQVLLAVGKEVPCELAIGMNGWVWIRASTARQRMAISHALQLGNIVPHHRQAEVIKAAFKNFTSNEYFSAMLKSLFEFSIFNEVKRMNKRQLFYQVLNCMMIVCSALMTWKSLIVLTGSESPVVVVLSGSMEPAFYRGDLLFLTNTDDPIHAGDVTVFKIEGREIPIVHRVLKVHQDANGEVLFLTKGDNNAVDDRGLYAPGQFWLKRKDVIGRAKGCVPYVGIVTILMNDYPKLKYVLLSVLAAVVLLHRE